MEEFFATTINIEKLSKDDVKLLKKRLKIFNTCLKFFYSVLLIAAASIFLIVVFHTKIENINSIIDKYNIFLELYLFYFFSALIFVFTPFLLLYIFFLEQILKGNYVVVCTGVVTNIHSSGSIAGGSYIYIGPLTLILNRWLPSEIKIGTCIQYRYSVRDYCISIKRYNKIMYDPEKIYKIEEENLPRLSAELLATSAIIKEMLRWEKLEAEKVRKQGIKGRLISFLWKIHYFLYKGVYYRDI